MLTDCTLSVSDNGLDPGSSRIVRLNSNPVSSLLSTSSSSSPDRLHPRGRSLTDSTVHRLHHPQILRPLAFPGSAVHRCSPTPLPPGSTDPGVHRLQKLRPFCPERRGIAGSDGCRVGSACGGAGSGGGAAGRIRSSGTGPRSSCTTASVSCQRSSWSWPSPARRRPRSCRWRTLQGPCLMLVQWGASRDSSSAPTTRKWLSENKHVKQLRILLLPSTASGVSTYLANHRTNAWFARLTVSGCLSLLLLLKITTMSCGAAARDHDRLSMTS